MRLHPRHYVLFLVIVAVFVFNIVRSRSHYTALAPKPAPIVVQNAPPAQTPGWLAFDHAAGLRDAPAGQFAPALQAVQQQLPADPNAADLRGCLTWLEFYRQGMAQSNLTARADPQMRDRSLHHLAGCTRYHLDTTATP
jgi:hypothetical protein